MLKGKITRLLKDGRGFIETHDGDRYDFHHADLEEVEFEKLEIGLAVEFMKNPESHPDNPSAIQIKTSLRRVV
jgi:cold shock CspA family protein